MTNDGTKIPYKATTDQTGRYIFPGPQARFLHRHGRIAGIQDRGA